MLRVKKTPLGLQFGVTRNMEYAPHFGRSQPSINIDELRTKVFLRIGLSLSRAGSGRVTESNPNPTRDILNTS